MSYQPWRLSFLVPRRVRFHSCARLEERPYTKFKENKRIVR